MSEIAEDENFVRADGLDYRRFLSSLHEKYVFDWYMEVGCRSGKSFANVRSNTIAVDPVFSIRRNVTGIKSQLHLFQKTSDDFFESSFLERNEIKLSVSFLDGMHLFDFLLRDFIAAERNSANNGIILLHDCCPWTHIMTTRDLDNIPNGPWTGDVWKLIPILQKYRPDLKVDILDCRPTGLVLISQLDPKNETLSDIYSDIVKEFIDIELVSYGPKVLYDSFSYLAAEDERNAGFPIFGNIGRVLDSAGNQKLTP